ncbi:MAG: flavin monoamine oxidase family protein [Chitinophagales bacterium]
MKNRTDVLIVGAGAAGLMAAQELSKSGFKVTILEARDRIGGRIFTMKNIFSHPVEAGAEFIHGDLPVTLGLIKEAGLSLRAMQGIFWQANASANANGNESSDPFYRWGELLSGKLSQLKEDMTLNEFLERNFQGNEFAGLKNSIRGFAEGYDAADPENFSTIAFRDEWMKDDEGQQFRIKGGYSSLLEWLASQIEKSGGEILLNKTVKKINWKKNEVEAISDAGEKFIAEKIIISVPLGVLNADASGEGAISFFPSVADKIESAKAMGYGAVMKIFLEFKESFWEPGKIKEQMHLDLPPLGFILSGERMPTWWTQFPDDFNLLTGWLAGPRAEKMKTLSDAVLLEDSLQSLAAIFKMKLEDLKSKLLTSKIMNWTVDPFARGAYTYSTVQSKRSREILSAPVEGTIFFCGEALYDGPEMGTVEAALSSGQTVAEKISAAG